MESRMAAMMESYERRFAAMERAVALATPQPTSVQYVDAPKPPTQYHASSIAGGLDTIEPFQPIPMDATIRARMQCLRTILASHGELAEWQLITLLKYAWGADKRHVEYTYDAITGHRIFHAMGKAAHGALVDTASGMTYFLHPHTGERVYEEQTDVDRSEWPEWLEEAVQVTTSYSSLRLIREGRAHSSHTLACAHTHTARALVHTGCILRRRAPSGRSAGATDAF
jgi:hypothetical protein